MFSHRYSHMQGENANEANSVLFSFFFCKRHHMILLWMQRRRLQHTESCHSLSANHPASAEWPRWAITAAGNGWRRRRGANICRFGFSGVLLLSLQWAPWQASLFPSFTTVSTAFIVLKRQSLTVCACVCASRCHGGEERHLAGHEPVEFKRPGGADWNFGTHGGPVSW